MTGMCSALPRLPPEVPAGTVPSWDRTRLVHRACPVCGEDRPKPRCTRPDGLLVVACGRCGLLYLPDVPDEASLSAFYAGYVESHRDALGGRPSGWGLALWWTHPLLVILEDAAGLRGRRLLEIGCSSGAFLERARGRGALVSGVEVDDVARAEARRAGLDCTAEIQRDARYEIACAFQVLEHLADPPAMLRQVSEVLLEDGVFLAAVPNGGQAERVGNTWIGFRRDLEHLQYFSIGTLATLLAAHGLFVESFWEEGQPAGMARLRRAPPGLLGRTWRGVRALWASSPARPFPAEGTFNLVVLARKAERRPRARP